LGTKGEAAAEVNEEGDEIPEAEWMDEAEEEGIKDEDGALVDWNELR
jgi:hypothetical protein